MNKDFNAEKLADKR